MDVLCISRALNVTAEYVWAKKFVVLLEQPNRLTKQAQLSHIWME
jgi:hypothetical protein